MNFLDMTLAIMLIGAPCAAAALIILSERRRIKPWRVSKRPPAPSGRRVRKTTMSERTIRLTRARIGGRRRR